MKSAEERWPTADNVAESSAPLDEPPTDDSVRIWVDEHNRQRVNDLKDELDLAREDKGRPTQDDVVSRALDLLEAELDDDLEEHREPKFDPASIAGEGVSGGRP